MLYDPARHEPVDATAWDEARVRAAIEHIVRDSEERFSAQSYWPLHPLDIEGADTDPAYPLYHGAAGVIWALEYLKAVGACRLSRNWSEQLEGVRLLICKWLAASELNDCASLLLGETSALMLLYAHSLDERYAARLHQLLLGNVDNPTRELLWGSPGSMLVALFLYEYTGEERWVLLYRTIEEKLWSQLLWSSEYDCYYWTQEMYGRTSTYIGAGHGFVGTAQPLIRGRHLLASERWGGWQERIATTVQKTATHLGDQVNWRAWLDTPDGQSGRMLMQYCHGAPGFIICLGDFPGRELDQLLVEAGEAIWAAGPLTKGSGLCHGTGGNGYAFLKLFERTGAVKWLERARAFAMHGILQTERDALLHGQLRYSLWTGDLGFAIYLWDCIRGSAIVPTVDVFYPSTFQQHAKHLHLAPNTHGAVRPAGSASG